MPLKFSDLLAISMALLLIQPVPAPGANHREAPITALDRAADITDWFAFVSYDDSSKVTMILNVDPLLDPANGPNYFPFDPEIVYTMKIDNDNDALEDVSFEFRFETEIRAPGVFTGFVGAGDGINAPANAPKDLAGGSPAGNPLIPRAITALDGPGSEGFSLRQTYTVTMIEGRGNGARRTELGRGRKLFAVPSNVGSRTMPDYAALARQGIYRLENGIRVWAGTADDPFYIDLGSTFDSLNLRGMFPSGVPGVLTMAQDRDDRSNFAPDSVAGYNVNSIAIEVPAGMLVRGGQPLPASDPRATIGTWGATYRPRVTIRRAPGEGDTAQDEPQSFRQVQRMGNPLVNEVIIGTGSKDKFSMSEPKDDAQFGAFVLDPLLARVLNAVTGGALKVPDAPRRDLLILAQYGPPIAAPGTPAGPVADLLRLNTGIPAAPAAARSRLGVLGGDFAGWPNGRRASDDVTDIALRAVAGVLVGGEFGGFPHNALGDGVNTNDVPYQETFPYIAWAQSGLRTRIAAQPARNLGSLECVLNPNSCR